MLSKELQDARQRISDLENIINIQKEEKQIETVEVLYSKQQVQNITDIKTSALKKSNEELLQEVTELRV